MIYLDTEIFVPTSKKSNWYNIIGWTSWFISLIILFALILSLIKFTLLLFVLGVAMLIIPILFLYVLNNFIMLPLNGFLDGKIGFRSDAVFIEQEEIFLSKIAEVHIKCNDYYRKYVFRGRGDFRPCLSQGVSNYITIKTTDGKHSTIYFRMANKQHKALLYPLIEEFVKQGKMPLMEGAELLGIKGYSKIQRFKQHYS